MATLTTKSFSLSLCGLFSLALFSCGEPVENENTEPPPTSPAGCHQGAYENPRPCEQYEVLDLASSPRSGHRAVSLEDGRAMILGGVRRGCDDGEIFEPFYGVEIFDPNTNTWAHKAPLPLHLVNFIVQPLPEGRWLVAGGRLHEGLLSNRAFRYDPIEDTWEAVTSMHYARWSSFSTRLRDGRILILGSHSDTRREGEIYDPQTDTWTLTAPFEFGAIESITTLPNNDVLVTYKPPSEGEYHSSRLSLALYIPGLREWSVLNDGKPSSHCIYESHRNLSLPDGRVVFVGGRDYDIEAECSAFFDPHTDTWTRLETGVAESAIYLGNDQLMTFSSHLQPRIFDLSTGRLSNVENNRANHPRSSVYWGRGASRPVRLCDGRILLTGDTRENCASQNNVSTVLCAP